MWPFSLIPDTIDPTLKNVIIFLIAIQFFAFLGYMIILCREHKQWKVKDKESETSTKSTSEPKTIEEEKSEEKRERSTSKNKKKLD